MDIVKFKKLLIVETTRFFSWRDNTEEGKRFVALNTNIYLDEFEMNADLSVFVSVDDDIQIAIEICQLNLSNDVLVLLNKFNSEIPYLNATIEEDSNGRPLLTLHANNIRLESEQNAVDYLMETVSYLQARKTVQYLEPLITLAK